MQDAIARLLIAFKGDTDLPADKLAAMATNPPDLINANTLQSILSGHNTAVNPDAVVEISNKLMPLFKELTKEFAVSAAAEAKVKNNAGNTYEQLVKPWGREIMQALDNLKFAPTPGKTTGGTEEDEKREEVFTRAATVLNDTYTKAVDAGVSHEDALQQALDAERAFIERELPTT
jgi:hypothetical protein